MISTSFASGRTPTKWDQITHPDDWPRVEKALNDHFAGLTPYYKQQYRARTKDGHWKRILGHGRVTRRDDKGNPVQAIGTHVDINNLKSNLTDITSPFSRKFSTSHLCMTSREIQIANLIREGKSTKEISELLGRSLSAIQFHRCNIRKKSGWLGKKITCNHFCNP